jgi:hypothetical protein
MTSMKKHMTLSAISPSARTPYVNMSDTAAANSVAFPSHG